MSDFSLTVKGKSGRKLQFIQEDGFYFGSD